MRVCESDRNGRSGHIPFRAADLPGRREQLQSPLSLSRRMYLQGELFQPVGKLRAPTGEVHPEHSHKTFMSIFKSLLAVVFLCGASALADDRLGVPL
jgi:hypothetical protein